MKSILIALLVVLVCEIGLADDITCGASLISVDKGAEWGIKGEPQDAVIKLKQNENGNYHGWAKLSFRNGEYNQFVAYELGDNKASEMSWASITATLVQTKNKKNKILGAISIPNTYYRDGNIAPVQVEIGNQLVLNKIADLPGVFQGKFDFIKHLSNGDIIGTTMQCYFE